MNILVTKQTSRIGAELESRYPTDFEFFHEGPNRYGKDEFGDNHQYTRILGDLGKLHGDDLVILHCSAPRPNSSKDRLYKLIWSAKDLHDSLGKVEVEEGKFEKRYFRFTTNINGKDVPVKPKTVQVFYVFPPEPKQDWVDLPGGVNAAELHMFICECLGVDRSYFLDAHFEGASFLKDYDVVYTTVQHKLVEEVRKNHPEVRMVDADEGGAERAKRRGLEHPSLIKIRTNDSDKNRIIVPPEVRRYIMGREVGILEDMSGSGGTLMDSIDALYDHGAEDVFCAYTHSQLPGGYMRVKEHLSKKFPEKEPYDRIYTTNSIGTQDRFVVNVTDTIVETLKKAA